MNDLIVLQNLGLKNPAFYMWALHFVLGLLAFLMPALFWLTWVMPLLWAVVWLNTGHSSGFWGLLGYGLGAEVLWRMAPQPFPWETSKYLLLVLGLGFLIWHGVQRRKWPLSWRPWLALGLLIPSFWVSVPEFAFLKFTYLGLLVGGLWLSLLPQTNPVGSDSFAVSLLAPLFWMMGLTCMGLLYGLWQWRQFENLTQFAHFVANMRLATFSFGPNQVAWHYVLGLVTSIYLATRSPQKVLFFLPLMWLVLITLCLSRGPFYFGLFLWLTYIFRGHFHKKGMMLAAFILVLGFILSPFGHRILDLDFSNRFANMRGDFQTWTQHVIWGAGPGGGAALRKQLSGSAISHFEPMRLLAEHGVFGFLFLAITLFWAWRFRPRPTSFLFVACFLFVAVYFCHSSTRTLAPLAAIILAYWLNGPASQGNIEDLQSSPPDQ